MNDTQALFSRLTALAAYFEGGRTRWQTEQVFSPRAILAQGRTAPTERIRAAEEAEEGFSPRAALEQLLQALPQEALQSLFSAPQAPTSPAFMTPNGVKEGGFAASPTAPRTPNADPEALSRAFSRDARRYDE